MAWIVAWTVVTTAAVVLGYFRMTFGLHEILGVRLGSPHQKEFYLEQQTVERKLNKIDMVGIGLTLVSAVMMLVIVALWAIQSAGPM
jgi:hypothetical protein